MPMIPHSVQKNVINYLCAFPLIFNVNFGCDFQSHITGMEITVQLTKIKDNMIHT